MLLASPTRNDSSLALSCLKDGTFLDYGQVPDLLLPASFTKSDGLLRIGFGGRDAHTLPGSTPDRHVAVVGKPANDSHEQYLRQGEVQMTAEMAFECVLVSRDASVLSTMNKVLENFSISTNVCFTSSKAADQLSEGSADLVIVDWEETTAELLGKIQKSESRQKPTVVAVSNQPVPGAHLVLRKPLTGESCTKSLKVAYSIMLRDHRRYARYALMTCVTAENQHHRTIPLTVMDIGDGGVGLMTRELLAIGDILSFRLLLPGLDRSIYIEARVLWTRQYGAAGCAFVRIPPVDLNVLHEWLKLKCKIKQPLIRV